MKHLSENFTYGAMALNFTYKSLLFAKMNVDNEKPLNKFFVEERFGKIVNFATQKFVALLRICTTICKAVWSDFRRS